RWLAAVGLLVAAGLAPAQLVDGGPLSGGVGERTWVATGSGDYRLGVGAAVLDLRQLPLASGTEIDVELGIGELVVRVPEGMTVQVDARVAAGEVRLPLEDDRQSVAGLHVGRAELVGPKGAVEVTLSAQVGVGSLQVRRG
ncbi:MAG: PspC domain protein, partial [Frankiales bacterium]|nr:PspC domain protein [Frankiales bacterium]